MIKAVLFDFGGVLTEGGKQGFVGQTIAELYGLPYESVDIADLHADLRRGKSDAAQFFAEINRRYGHTKQITEAQFLEKTVAACVPSPKLYDLASRIRDHGIKTAIFSNIFKVNARLLEKEGWYKGFAPLFLSCDEGFAKPDIEMYELAVQRLGIHPQEILLIDDQEKCLPPAKKLGMHTIQAISPEQTVADTEALLKAHNQIEL